MIFSIIIAIIFIVLAVVFLMGKGDKLIAGYNTASKEEKKSVNIKRLRIIMALVSVLTAGYVSTWPLIGNNPQAHIGALLVFFFFTLIFAFLANTWAKKK